MRTCSRPFVLHKVNEFAYIYLFYLRWSGFAFFVFFCFFVLFFFFKGCFLSVYSHCPLCRFTLFFQASVACLAIIDSKSYACQRGDVFESQL